MPVAKPIDAVADRAAPVGDRVGMVHMATAVTEGQGRIVVTDTGSATQMGRIGALIAGVAARGTPLVAKLA